MSPTSAPAVDAAARSTEETLPWLVAGYCDGTVRLFDLNRVEMILKLHPHASSTTAVCFSADGNVYWRCTVIICYNCNPIYLTTMEYA